MSVAAPVNAAVEPLGEKKNGFSDSGVQSETSDANALPSASEVAKAAAVYVLDGKGEKHTFESLFSTADRNERRLIIFVRHFFCGMCQDFLRHFAATITPEYLSSLSHPTKVIIIGCGSPDLIDRYASNTNCPYPIYANPDRELYQVFDMSTTLDMGSSRPESQRESVFDMVLKSTRDALGSGMGMFKGGKVSQVGGELLFAGGECLWCHRMQNTRDHSTIASFKEALEH